MPDKLCKTAGSIHLFQVYGQLTLDQITLERKYLWDIIRIDWREVFVTLNGTIIQLPISVKNPFRDKYGAQMHNENRVIVVTCHAETGNVLVCFR